MATSEHVAGKLLNSRTFGIAGLMLLFGSGPSWAGPPNPTASDALGNTAGGSGALTANTTGGTNTAFGDGALITNTTGSYNTASGTWALYMNVLGEANTASGEAALFSNVNGGYNTASGSAALVSNVTGGENTADGAYALEGNTAGGGNTAVGYEALYDTKGSGNTAVGLMAGLLNTIGNNNTFIGNDANPSAGSLKNGTALGYRAELLASNSIVLGNTSISKIYAQVTSITAISDRRDKKDIRALDGDLGLDFIGKLKPVSYRFNNGDETERYGFIAQDLEQALPAALHDTIERSEPEHGLALIERQNDKDRTYRVSYGELTAPMVTAIQQQQQEIEALRQQNADLRRALEAVEYRVSALVRNAALHHSIRGQREQFTAAQ